MSTRSRICAKTAKGDWRVIYCHSDGYPEGVGKILAEHYTDQKKIDALTALGDLSILEAECTKPRGHSFAHRVNGYTVAYHRDRGERWEDTKPSEGATFEEALVAFGDAGWQDYTYIWDGQSWTVQCDGQGPFSTLTPTPPENLTAALEALDEAPPSHTVTLTVVHGGKAS